MEIPLISKRQFNRFKKFLPVPGNAEKISAIVVISCGIWVIRYGRSWAEIPEKYGKADTIRKRFMRWSKRGVFREVFDKLASGIKKRSEIMLDSTVVKAHRMAASMKSDGKPRKIGRSVGGLTTKIHFMATTEKIPVDFSLTGGEVNDSREGKNLILKNMGKFKKLLADKAYDTDEIRNMLEKNRKIACIPPKSNRKNPPSYDRKLYEKRSRIENMFSRIKDWKGIAMRFCRCAHAFESFVSLTLISLFFDVL